MKLEIFIKYKIIIIILIFPILCYITRKISPSLKSNKFKDFNNKSFFGKTEFILKNNSMKNELQIQKYNYIRIYTEANYNSLKLYFKINNDKYYDSERIEFELLLYGNESSIINNNNIIYYKETIGKDSNCNVKFKEHKLIYDYFFNKKTDYIIKNVSFKYLKNNTSLQCELYFRDFDLILNLKNEKLTIKFFYLFELFINIVFLKIILTKIIKLENNLQNISIIFLLFIRAKNIISFIFILLDINKIGIPIKKILIFYFHLLIYGENLLSITDIMISIIIFIFIFIIIVYYIKIKDNEGNYFYSFNNSLINGQIMYNISPIYSIKKIFFKIILYLFCLFFELSNSIYIQFIPLILAIFSAIIKHLFQREVMCSKDKEFCLSFYLYGIINFLYYLFIFNLGKFYRIKCSFAIVPFVLILILYNILKYIIQNEYKVKFIMREDFAILKNLKDECCSICIKDFKYNNKNDNVFFCKINELDNIHKTRCHHYFHEKCLFIWRKHKNICPICKRRLDVPKYYYFYDYIPCIYKWKYE